MSQRERRRYDRSLKVSVVRRLESGESAAVLSAELGIDDSLLYTWRATVRAGGEAALRDPGRPRRDAGQDAGGELRDLEGARRRIEALQRKIGEQEMALDFFAGALRRIEAGRRPNGGPGATGSSPRSRR